MRKVNECRKAKFIGRNEGPENTTHYRLYRLLQSKRGIYSNSTSHPSLPTEKEKKKRKNITRNSLQTREEVTRG
jgi:hypothetical protein